MASYRMVIISGALIVSLVSLISLQNKSNVPARRSQPIPVCGSLAMDWSDTTLKQSQLLPGLGDHHYKVTTRSAEAQKFFDQGLKLIYAFNHWEAIRSFRYAISLDPDFAMAYWGLALAYGPNLNDVNPKDREAFAFDAIRKAVEKSKGARKIEQDLINALATRYDGKAYDDRQPLNDAYAKSMVAISQKYRDDPEVLTQCADALMNTMPWDYWEKDGGAKAGTQKAKLLLETALKKQPMHPGANHLYIHLVEASPDPEQGLPSAEALEAAMPKAGHIVHMPAHIFLRVGQYDKAIAANVRAVAADEEYLANSDNRGMYRWSYYPHNIDFISYSSYMQGRSKLGIETALKLAYKGNLISRSNPVYSQYFAIEPLIAYTRFGKWNDILSLEEPDKDLVYAQLLYRFAKGMALLRTQNLELARVELAKLDSIAGLDTLKSVYATFNAVSDVAKIPNHILHGEVAMASGNPAEGFEHLQNAVEAEDALRYMEPPDWKLPSRQYLGAALLQQKRYADAEKVFMEDLADNPNNGWSLYGLYMSHAKLGKQDEAADSKRKSDEAWKEADFPLEQVVF